jgi:CO/xanthine dehydrogenase FAD-binding subunit
MNNITNHLFPESEESLLKLLREPNSQILAGGTDLSINPNQTTQTLIDLQCLPLNYINETEKGFSIGAMTTAYSLYVNKKITQSLRDAAFKVSDTPLLHAVTIGGNIAKLYPWCDLPPMLWALNASFKLYEKTGEYKELNADAFFAYSKEQNVSNRNSFIIEVFVPKSSNNSFSQYQKFGLTEVDKGQVNMASFFSWDKEGVITDARIIISAITKTIQKLDKIEKLLVGKKLSDQLINSCVEEVEKSVEIVPNYKSSVEFRAQILRTYLRRTLTSCMEVAK